MRDKLFFIVNFCFFSNKHPRVNRQNAEQGIETNYHRTFCQVFDNAIFALSDWILIIHIGNEQNYCIFVHISSTI